jgi:hypothetical protein
MAKGGPNPFVMERFQSVITQLFSQVLLWCHNPTVHPATYCFGL